MLLKGMIHSFQTHLGTSKTVKNRYIYEVIISSPPSASLIKNAKLNCKPNTDHINIIKPGPESYHYWLSAHV